jgi:hypothetical protein
MKRKKKKKQKRIRQSPSLEYLESGSDKDDERCAESFRRVRPTREALRIQSDKVFTSLSSDQRDAIMLALFEGAYMDVYKESGSRYLKESQRDALLDKINAITGLDLENFDVLRHRISRIRQRGTSARAPGSGRKKKFTEEHLEAAKEVAREFGGDISRTKIYETVAERFGPENVNSRSKFLENMREGFKRRRIRYKPTLNDGQKQDRVNYASAQIATDFKEESRSIFADEKRFEANSSVFNLPIEDDTPQRRIQSKSNPVFVMELAVVMAPRGNWNGIVAIHPFVERVAASRKSKNREQGTMEWKAVNVTKDNYVAAWKDAIIPALKQAILDKKIPKPTKKNPLLFQDDNAKPHRGLYKDGMDVSHYICHLAAENGVLMEPKDPAQPAQSPDLNPLDTFIFRLIAGIWRRLRAQDRVQQMAASNALSRAREEDQDDLHNHVVRRLRLPQSEDGDGDEVEDEEIVQKTVPLRCKPEETRKLALCGGCSEVVSNSDRTAVKCDLRGGWWHFNCVKKQVGGNLYPRAVLPDLDSDTTWVCPQCSMHLCQNDDRTKHLCLVCWKPSARTGEHDMGTDMIACDGPTGGLFHKKCVGYDEQVAAEADFWYCAACQPLDEEEYVPLEQIEERPISGTNPFALHKAVQIALGEIPLDSFKRGFETRCEIIKKVVADEGGNSYSMHWRGDAKKNE